MSRNLWSTFLSTQKFLTQVFKGEVLIKSYSYDLYESDSTNSAKFRVVVTSLPLVGTFFLPHRVRRVTFLAQPGEDPVDQRRLPSETILLLPGF